MAQQRGKRGSVRIIGGEWRGRRLTVPDLPGLRPSGDRGRETLFNWLMPHLAGARAVDLFAGTGVLGFEAISRGAAAATLVENSPVAAEALRVSVALLHAERVRVVEADALAWLAAQPPGTMDLVFVDPPFELGLAGAVLGALAQSAALRAGGLVYLESPSNEDAPPLPSGWECLRDTTVGDVRMQLLRKG